MTFMVEASSHPEELQRLISMEHNANLQTFGINSLGICNREGTVPADFCLQCLSRSDESRTRCQEIMQI